MKRKPFFLSALYLAMGVVLLAACAAPPNTCPPLKPGGVEFKFETVDQNVYSEAIETDVFLITGSQDVYQLEELLYEDAFTQLVNVNYDDFSAVTVFQGHKNTGGYKVTIERLSVQEHELSICATFLEPGPHQPVGNIETSPYHIIKVSKTDLSSFSVVVLHSFTTTP